MPYLCGLWRFANAYDSSYDKEERGAGYLQVTWKENQVDCLNYICELFGYQEYIDPSLDGYAELIAAKYPWEAAAWYWAVYPKGGVESEPPLNNYIMDRLSDNSGALTLGIVLTAESFVYGSVFENNKDGGYTMDDALHVIARYDSLRINDEGNNGGWYIEESGKEYTLYIPAEMLEIEDNEDGTPSSNISSEWNTSDYLHFNAPHNWGTFEIYYNKLQDAGLINFDLNTELP